MEASIVKLIQASQRDYCKDEIELSGWAIHNSTLSEPDDFDTNKNRFQAVSPIFTAFALSTNDREVKSEEKIQNQLQVWISNDEYIKSISRAISVFFINSKLENKIQNDKIEAIRNSIINMDVLTKFDLFLIYTFEIKNLLGEKIDFISKLKTRIENSLSIMEPKTENEKLIYILDFILLNHFSPLKISGKMKNVFLKCFNWIIVKYSSETENPFQISQIGTFNLCLIGASLKTLLEIEAQIYSYLYSIESYAKIIKNKIPQQLSETFPLNCAADIHLFYKTYNKIKGFIFPEIENLVKEGHIAYKNQELENLIEKYRDGVTKISYYETRIKGEVIKMEGEVIKMRQEISLEFLELSKQRMNWKNIFISLIISIVSSIVFAGIVVFTQNTTADIKKSFEDELGKIIVPIVREAIELNEKNR